MDWINGLFSIPSALQAVVVISLICTIGLGLGKIKVAGISLGIAFVFFFGIANSFEQMTAEMQDHPAIRVIRMRKVPFIDSTGVHNLETLCRMSRRDGTRIILSGVRPEVREGLSRTGFPELIGEGNICSHISIALRRAEQMVEAHRGATE